MILYYNQLSERDKRIYDALLPAILNMETHCSVENIAFSENERTDIILFNIVQMILSDYPEIFWAPNVYKNTSSDDNKISVSIGYGFSKEEKEMHEQLVNAYIDVVFSQFSSLPDYDFAVAVFDWLTRNISYNDSESFKQCDNSIYGAFALNSTRCLGYSCAFSILMKKKNIRCGICIATLYYTRHVWNIVELDGVWCHVDACWADRGDLHSGESVSMSRYIYFGMTEDEAVFDCRVSSSSNIYYDNGKKRIHGFIPRFDEWPKADSDQNNYYIRKGLYFKNETEKEICHAIGKELMRTDKNISDRRVSIRFENSEAMSEFVKNASDCVRRLVSHLNKDLNTPLRLNSASYNKKHKICDLFFVPC